MFVLIQFVKYCLKCYIRLKKLKFLKFKHYKRILTMKNFAIYFTIVIAVLIIFVMGFLFFKPKYQHQQGVWWWNNKLDSEKYLNFCKSNNVNEIYYWCTDFNESASDFIKSANELGIEVYLLAGDKSWLEDVNLARKQLDQYQKFIANNDKFKFKGVHLDIEPHQFADFKTNREKRITQLIEFASLIKNEYPNIKFDYDLPFWFEDEIFFEGEAKPAFAHIMDMSNRVFIMSYRDSADAILKCAKEEIDYAIKTNKAIFLCIETGEEEEGVTFLNFGKKFMNCELDKVKKQIPKHFGIAIHDINRWFDLKD